MTLSEQRALEGAIRTLLANAALAEANGFPMAAARRRDMAAELQARLDEEQR